LGIGQVAISCRSGGHTCRCLHVTSSLLASTTAFVTTLEPAFRTCSGQKSPLPLPRPQSPSYLSRGPLGPARPFGASSPRKAPRRGDLRQGGEGKKRLCERARSRRLNAPSSRLRGLRSRRDKANAPWDQEGIGAHLVAPPKGPARFGRSLRQDGRNPAASTFPLLHENLLGAPEVVLPRKRTGNILLRRPRLARRESFPTPWACISIPRARGAEVIEGGEL
jgi:hypothetical protein